MVLPNASSGFENINDMLVPVVWFEESAMIPEESAQKFKSLYTNRIRLINLVLFSMFLASILLIAIDLRLLLATNHWREFKIIKLATSGCQSMSATRPTSTAKVNPVAASDYMQKAKVLQLTSERKATTDSRTSGLASSLGSQLQSRRKESTASTDSCSSSQELTLATDDDDEQATVTGGNDNNNKQDLLISAQPSDQSNEPTKPQLQQARLSLKTPKSNTTNQADDATDGGQQSPPHSSEPAQVDQNTFTSTVSISNEPKRNFHTQLAKRSIVDLNSTKSPTIPDKENR